VAGATAGAAGCGGGDGLMTRHDACTCVIPDDIARVVAAHAQLGRAARRGLFVAEQVTRAQVARAAKAAELVAWWGSVQALR